MADIHVIGAGLAGSEAVYQLAKRGFSVMLHEMKPNKKSPAHQSDHFAELVCSNSFRSQSMRNAAGLLKDELKMLDSLIMQAAEATAVPAGGALAVDRERFSAYVTDALKTNENIKVVHEEVTSFPEKNTIIATGPLTSEALFESIKEKTGEDMAYFFDAVAPIIDVDSIDMDIAYYKNRYDKEGGMYINCPMDEETYNRWYDALIHAETVQPKDFEMKVFEGCMPVEEIAGRGKQTLLFGPMKPVGLQTPDGKRPHGVVQLRQDNIGKTLYNMVGFQTHLTFPEQRRIIRMIPGLENAKIVRYGVMHRNGFIKAPKLLDETYMLKDMDNVYVAGQLSGVEGYVESVGSGMVAAINMARRLKDDGPLVFPRETMLGAEAYYLAHATPSDFQPMNANFGLVPPLGYKHKKRERKERMYKRSIEIMKTMKGDGLFG